PDRCELLQAASILVPPWEPDLWIRLLQDPLRSRSLPLIEDLIGLGLLKRLPSQRLDWVDIRWRRHFDAQLSDECPRDLHDRAASALEDSVDLHRVAYHRLLGTLQPQRNETLLPAMRHAWSVAGYEAALNYAKRISVDLGGPVTELGKSLLIA